jgi:ribosomal protein S18 acetylase RimI-like enzyme
MNDAALAAAVEANYLESFTALARACGGEVFEGADAVGMCSGLPVPALNHGFLRSQPSDLDRCLAEIVEFFDHRKVPFVLRVREGVAPKAERAMETMGFAYTDTVPGMALFPISDAPAPPAGLTIESVEDEAALDRYRQVAAQGFEMPEELATSLITPALLDVSGFESYLGSIDGEPVATASLYSAGGTAGIYNVSTLPAHRRRGFGEALTWHAVTRGTEQGCSVAILQASAMGEPVYTRMGFRNVAPHKSFTRPE